MDFIASAEMLVVVKSHPEKKRGNPGRDEAP
jgi:hypothetical protein